MLPLAAWGESWQVIYRRSTTLKAKDVAPPVSRVKTETLSLRLDPKVKFMLDFMARVNGQNITTAVERAVLLAADNAKIGADDDVRRSWANFWDIDEGVRTVKLLSDQDYPKNFAEDELVSFFKDHWEFFYIDQSKRGVHRYYIELLWPKLDEYLEIWRSERQTNYWAAGKAMKADIEKAGIAAPVWPRKGTETKNKRVLEVDDLDDEIPF